MNSYFQLLRIKHWIKNIIIFLPLLFGSGLTSPTLLKTALIGFIVFCGISSVVYILNDIHDVEKDRHHQTKCKRPIASGKISIRSARLFAILILSVSIVIGIAGFGANLCAWLILMTYLAINILYSRGLKNIPLLDICIISAGFLLRVIFGAVITDITISKWMLITIIAISLYLSLYKRKTELRMETDSEKTRSVLKTYTESFLDKNLILCMTLVLVFYSLWCIDDLTISRLGDNIIWTIPLVLIICMKYQLNEKTENQDPISIVLKDKILLGLCALYAIVTILIIYGFI